MRHVNLACLGLCVTLTLLSGCQRGRRLASDEHRYEPVLPAPADDASASRGAESPLPVAIYTTQCVDVPARGASRRVLPSPLSSTPRAGDVTPASLQSLASDDSEAPDEATLIVDDRSSRVQLLEDPTSHTLAETEGVIPVPTRRTRHKSAATVDQTAQPNDHANALEMNLPTALSLVGGQHPVVGLAQWRVQEAYASLDQARVLWLPSLQPGFSFHRHDGNYQASNGDIVDVNRNSFQFGMGAGATGAGTTPRPGVAAQFHVADAIFQPDIAMQNAWARGHRANAVVNEQLLTVSTAYLRLLAAEQDLQIAVVTRQQTADLARLTSDYAIAGEGLQSDADRLTTELRLADSRVSELRERADVTAAQLAAALSINANRRIVPLDPTVLPIELVPAELDQPTLIATGLATRSELKEAQALVAAACDEFQRQKYAPFVPSVLLGVTAGGFGGGLGNRLSDIEDRYDFDALLTWEVRNLGFGERAARRATHARVEQAKFEKIRLLDQVAREISESHAQVRHRADRIPITQSAITSAEDSFRRNLTRIRDGQGLPIEVLQSIRALQDARRAYLNAVISYNEAQFRLQWALGWPVTAPQ